MMISESQLTYDDDSVPLIYVNGVPERRCYIFASQRAPTTNAPSPSPPAVGANMVSDVAGAAMRVLNCDDTVAAVVDSFRRDTYDAEDRLDLLNLLLVNRAFFPSAAALLWSECTNPGLKSLWDIMDSSRAFGSLEYISNVLCECEDDEITELEQDISTSIEWNHFLYYASLIKVAAFHSALIDDSGLLPFFSSMVSDGSSILCSLQQLMWDQGPVINDTLLYLLGGHLVSLHVGVIAFQDQSECEPAYSAWVQRFMAIASAVCPNLLRFSVSSQGPALTDNCSSTTTYFEHLHRVPIQVLEQDASGEWSEKTAPSEFQFLTDVSFGAVQGSRGVFSSLHAVTPLFAHTLRVINLVSLRVAWYTESTAFKFFVGPLLALPALTSVTMTLTHHIIIFENNDLSAVTKAWPKLENLELSFGCDPSDCSGLSLQSIVEAAERCTSLIRLSVPYVICPSTLADAVLPTMSQSPLLSFVCHQIQFGWPVTRAALTDSLCRAFPKLKPDTVFLGPWMILI